MEGILIKNKEERIKEIDKAIDVIFVDLHNMDKNYMDSIEMAEKAIEMTTKYIGLRKEAYANIRYLEGMRNALNVGVEE